MFRYQTDRSFSQEQKDFLNITLRNAVGDYAMDLKSANKDAVKHTVEVMRRKMCDPDEVNYQPELLKDIVVAVMDYPLVLDMLRELLTLSKEELDNRWGMIGYRNFLMAMLLLFGNGQRPGTLENMIIAELMDIQTVHGLECVRVADHKTAKSFGPASVAFAIPGLWQACVNFVKHFR